MKRRDLLKGLAAAAAVGPAFRRDDTASIQGLIDRSEPVPAGTHRLRGTLTVGSGQVLSVRFSLRDDGEWR